MKTCKCAKKPAFCGRDIILDERARRLVCAECTSAECCRPKKKEAD